MDSRTHALTKGGTLLAMANDPVADLLALAATQRGAFTWANAVALGWSEAAGAVARRTAWTKLGRGVYVHTFVWEGFSERERHFCLAMARVLGSKSSWHAARRTAAMAHGFPLLGQDPTRPQLVRDPGSTGTRAVSRHERVAELPERDRQIVQGLPVTVGARTAIDIARSEPFMNAVVVADAALRAGASAEQLREAAARCASWPRGLDGMRVADFANGLSESALESMSRVRFHTLGIPAPELQIAVFLGDELLARLDFLWRQYNAVGLADGAIKYDSREDVMAEKWQVERLEDVGLEVGRWGWTESYARPADLEYKVRRAMDRGSRQTLDPRVRFVVTTVEENVRANQRLERRRSG